MILPLFSTLYIFITFRFVACTSTFSCFHLRPTVDLIGAMETQSEPSELELDDVVITNPHIEAILENEDWIEDASYVKLSFYFSHSIH